MCELTRLEAITLPIFAFAVPFLVLAYGVPS